VLFGGVASAQTVSPDSAATWLANGERDHQRRLSLATIDWKPRRAA
jgi:hypothetical protein